MSERGQSSKTTRDLVLNLVEPEVRSIMADFLDRLPEDVLEMVLQTHPTSLIKLLDPCFVEDDNKLKQRAYATWFKRQIVVPEFMNKVKWRKLFGLARDQGAHGVCWAFVVAELIEALMKMHNPGEPDTKYSPQDLINFAEPELRKEMNEKGHYCYGFTVKKGLRYVLKDGLQREHDRPFVGCPKRVRKRNKVKTTRIGGIYQCQQIGDIFRALKRSPVSAAMAIFEPEYTEIGDKIYTGPREAGSRLVGLHAINIVSAGVEAGEPYLLARSSHGPEFGCLGGYLKVSLDAMVLHLPRAGESVTSLDNLFSKPRSLLWAFVYPKLPPGEEKGKKETR